MSANPDVNSRKNYELTFPNYSAQEVATFLENGNREIGCRYEGETSLADVLEKETIKEARNQQNGRLAKNILREAIINLSRRLSFEDDGARLVTLGDHEDIIHGCRACYEPTEPPCQDITRSKVSEPK